jgi:hypothetical protein
MTVTSRICKGFTLTRTKMKTKLHRSVNRALISEASTSEKLLDVLLLRETNALRGRNNLKPKKVAKRTQISHQEFLMETFLHSSNELVVIPRDNHVINIEEQKGATTRRSVNK